MLARQISEPYLYEIRKLQPSQFYINESKLAACKKWIKAQGDIFVPVGFIEGKAILLDGHTRVRAAIDLGYEKIFVYHDEHDEHIRDFVEEAMRRGIRSVFDMEIIGDEEYRVSWYGFCDEYFRY